MKRSTLKKIETALWILFVLVGVVAVVCFVLLRREGRVTDIPEPNQEKIDGDENTAAGLSDQTILLPEHCDLYEAFPEISFEDEAGEVFHSGDFFGTPVVVVFWASWCEDCGEQMPHMKEFMELAGAYEEIRFLFINRTDGTRETKETAKEYFDELGLDAACYYDVGETAYRTLGIKNIPTTFFVDEKGTLLAWSAVQITKESVFEAYLDNLCRGNRASTQDFVTGKMTDPSGGVHTTYVPGDEAATMASPVLSESQGVMLEYAVQSGQKELFDSTLSYINGSMNRDGLIIWSVTDGQAGSVNALVDDLRIYGALLQAQSLWGGYDEILKAHQGALTAYGIRDGRYVDFYDAKSRKAAESLTLCYIDLYTMKALADVSDECRNAYEDARQILINGQISDDFPLFYSRYDYKTKSYAEGELNMAEAMVTLLHLAEAGILPQNTHDWLRKQMEYGAILARYDVNGRVVEGYQYESTAIYALTALIGREIGDESLQGWALRKMEKMRIRDCGKAYNGAFGGEDGSGITSFDQMIPLLVYGVMECTDE